MSNLWKALRDVSRDVDPTIGFESSSHGSDGESPMPGPPVSDHVSAPNASAEDPAAAPPRPAPARRPMTANRPRPLPRVPQDPIEDPASDHSEVPKRLNPLQASLRRRPLAEALQFDTPADPNGALGNRADPNGGVDSGALGNGGVDSGAVGNRVVRPPQFNAAAPNGPRHCDEVPSSPTARRGPAPGVAWNTEAVRFPTVAPRTPALGEPAPAPPPPQSRPYGGLTTGSQGSGGSAGPSRSPAPANANGVDPQVRPARFAAHSGAVPPVVGTGRHPTNEAPFSPTAGLPDALRAFAPGALNRSMDVAAITSGTQWKPGDDDVMPGDGRRPRRPRLWDRLPW